MKSAFSFTSLEGYRTGLLNKQVADIHSLGVAPELFELEEIAVVTAHDVYHHRAEIEYYPLSLAVSVDPQRSDAA